MGPRARCWRGPRGATSTPSHAVGGYSSSRMARGPGLLASNVHAGLAVGATLVGPVFSGLIGEVVEPPPGGREGGDVSGHELHRQVVRGVAGPGHLGVAFACNPVSHHCGEVFEAGIVGAPVDGFVTGQVELTELRVGEVTGLFRCPRRDQFGGQGGNKDSSWVVWWGMPVSLARGRRRRPPRLASGRRLSSRDQTRARTGRGLTTAHGRRGRPARLARWPREKGTSHCPAAKERSVLVGGRHTSARARSATELFHDAAQGVTTVQVDAGLVTCHKASPGWEMSGCASVLGARSWPRMRTDSTNPWCWMQPAQRPGALRAVT
jgi:hypothetical protein